MTRASRGSHDRGGFTVLEALVGLLLGWLLAGLVLATLSAQRRAQEALARRADVLSAVRTARHVLGQEARASLASGAPTLPGRDSLGVRGVRGWGPACPASPGAQALWVRPEGMRLPEAESDSVAVFSGGDEPAARLLLSREPASRSCAGVLEDGWERWEMDRALPGGAVYVAWFRPGSYHLNDRALRYRSGTSGRQPLTPEVFDPAGTGFVPVPRGLVVTLATAGGDGWRVVVPGGGPGG